MSLWQWYCAICEVSAKETPQNSAGYRWFCYARQDLAGRAR